MGGEALLVEEEVFTVGQVAADAHVGIAGQGEPQVAHGGEEAVEGGAAVQPVVPAFVAAVAQHYFGARGEVAGHQAQPLVALRAAVGLGQHQPVVAGGADTQRDGQLLAADVARGVGHKAVVQVGVLLFELGQIFLAFALLAVVDDDDFELRIVLLKDGGQVAAQVLYFVVGTEDDRQGRQFLREMQFVASGLAAAQVDAVVEGEVVEGLDDEQDTGSGQQILFGSVECECFHLCFVLTDAQEYEFSGAPCTARPFFFLTS